MSVQAVAERKPPAAVPEVARAELLPVEVAATALAEAPGKGDVLFVARDDARAAAIAAILEGLVPDACVVALPSSDAMPGEDSPPSPANVGKRTGALRQLRAGKGRRWLVTSAEATVARYAAPDAFDAMPPVFAIGDALELDGFAELAEGIGYQQDDRVDEPGEIAVRGGVVDVFPVDSDGPVRIEVADGKVASVRRYDPVSQLSVGELERIEIGQAREPEAGDGVALSEHLSRPVLLLDDGADERRERFLKLVVDAKRRGKVPVVDADEWKVALKKPGTALAADWEAVPRFVERRSPTRAFTSFARQATADGRLLLAGSPRDLRFLAHRLGKSAKLDFAPVSSWAEAVAAPVGTAMLLAAPLDRGFVTRGVSVVAGGDLLGGRARGDELAVSAIDPLMENAGRLKAGDVVVHEEFGIGRVVGLEALPDGGDAIVLEYAKEARRLVPVLEADRIWRYGADADAVTLDTLDGHSWQKRRGAIDQAVAESARGLAEIAAERDEQRTDPIEPDAAAYERFAGGFAFTETADQARAIQAVAHDLKSGRPMDRLVVGDVGYGKTEVALRAAAMVALSGCQVAIAAPTTVLVRQHMETFAERFRDAGIEVAGLSRLSSAAEKKRVKAGLADGSIKVVVGTGAVAGKGVEYQDLALVVVDEEQRFGAAEKAKLRALGAGHVLTLSATPIPRTLQSAMVGLQQISIIATPPARRQPIRTAMGTLDDERLRGALMRERGRGGQSFVVVPRIEDMAPLADRLARAVPELTVVQAHGKMAPAEIDEAMVGFARGEGDVLLATNIIEAGLDVPRANTMVVHRADRFGLSQLHQLRGRVGRGGRRGQVLLTTEEGASIAEATLKRLRTLQAFDRLGAGFAISARDLDLRGAGDLLGEAQAGHMKLIGVDLYQHLLGHALRAARGEAVDVWTPEMNLDLAGRLPEDWVPETDVRLSLYGRLARIDDESALDVFEAELEDRFGAIPDHARALLTLARLRLLARAAGIAKVDAGPAAIALTPHGKREMPAVDGLSEKNGRWLLAERIDDAGERAERVQELLATLAE